MKFIFSESGWAFFERMAYRGVIGLFYDSTLTGLLAYLIFFAVIGFAIIGLISTLKWLFTRKKKKKYYVRVRAYKSVSGKKVYGAWSKVKTVKTK